MPFPKKYEGSKTRGLRLDCVTHNFLRENFLNNKEKTANDFIIELIKNSDEYKNYLIKKSQLDNEPKLLIF